MGVNRGLVLHPKVDFGAQTKQEERLRELRSIVDLEMEEFDGMLEINP